MINPNGIVFGTNAIVDTQGLIASSLNLSNEDFVVQDGERVALPLITQR